MTSTSKRKLPTEDTDTDSTAPSPVRLHTTAEPDDGAACAARACDRRNSAAQPQLVRHRVRRWMLQHQLVDLKPGSSEPGASLLCPDCYSAACRAATEVRRREIEQRERRSTTCNRWCGGRLPQSLCISPCLHSSSG